MTTPPLRPAWPALLLLALLAPATARAGEEDSVRTRPLFRIERSVNANVVQYDARIDADGSLDRDEPVQAYWIRLAEDGRREDLSWMEKKLAYGFDAKRQDDGSVILDMKAEIRRPVKVVRGEKGWEARTRISGHTARITRIFVQVHDGRPLPKVLYIDLDGVDVETGENVHERFRPPS